MIRTLRWGPLALALALLPGARIAHAEDAHAAAALSRGLAGNGRAEATLRYAIATPSGGTRIVHATLALEPPDRARIDVPGSGEKLVARADGGEWLQPATRQLLRFTPRHAAAALGWWRVLLAPGHDARERQVAPGHWVLTLLSERGAPGDSAEVWLDPHGLPMRLVVPAGDPQGAVYRLNGWRFTHARGPAGFKLAAPAGFESVDMP